jgi:uncharacterized protein
VLPNAYNCREFFALTPEGEELSATEFLVQGDSRPTCLVLHGAGNSSKLRMEPFCRGLASAGLSTLSFDFSGHGQSSGSITRSSLSKKTSEALAMARLLSEQSPVTLCAFSMGGYIALRLLPHLKARVHSVLLFAPAIYDPAAFYVPFGPEFSKVIRAQESWRRSDAPELLRGFEGRLLIVVGNDDDVIPPAVIDLLYSSSSSAEIIEIVRLPGAPHQLGLWMRDNVTALRNVVMQAVALSNTCVTARNRSEGTEMDDNTLRNLDGSASIQKWTSADTPPWDEPLVEDSFGQPID